MQGIKHIQFEPYYNAAKDFFTTYSYLSAYQFLLSIQSLRPMLCMAIQGLSFLGNLNIFSFSVKNILGCTVSISNPHFLPRHSLFLACPSVLFDTSY